MLSRLKGIETAFRNSGATSLWKKLLWICFPVWREWKHSQMLISLKSLITLDMLSRLKGMETVASVAVTDNIFDFGYAFPFEGNGNLCQCGDRLKSQTLDMLSRLKGMETQFHKLSGAGSSSEPHYFGYAFPVEGNGNTISKVAIVPPSYVVLWICFPVWREWKRRIDHHRLVLTKTLDMLSRLKGIETHSHILLHGDRCIFGYAFPFEGNWNPMRKKRHSWSNRCPLDMLSRLKGMET